MSTYKYLDGAGLGVLWERIKQLVYECCCSNQGYECVNDQVMTSECFEKAVLSVTGGGGGGDCGYSCESTVVFEGNVTTTLDMSIAPFAILPITIKPPTTLTITFDGTTYVLDRQSAPNAIEETWIYGAPDPSDFSDYPFAIVWYGGEWEFYTPNVGTYALKIEEETVTTTECFDRARGFSCSEKWVTLTEEELELNEASKLLDYAKQITANPIRVTLNGVEYICPRNNGAEPGEYYYGEDTSDGTLTDYPFTIRTTPAIGNVFYTHTVETDYEIKIEALDVVATTTECFDKAVQSVCGALIIEGDITQGSELNHTFAEIREALASGRGVIYHYVASGLTENTPWYTSFVTLLDDGDNTRIVTIYNPNVALLNAYVEYAADSDDDYPYIPASPSPTPTTPLS